MATTYVQLFLVASLLALSAQGARFARDDAKLRAADKITKEENLTPDAAADRILSLPGFQNALPSNQFGGYITVDEDHGRNLYYYFVESLRDPANDPVVLWLNGGPGCSSFDGFIYEHGPFLYSLERKPGGRGSVVQLDPNPFAWNQVANMIFLDSPAGVGLSYSHTASDYVVEDARTAADADAFLRGWFRRFPAYLKNDFYVSGESYAGIYVPNLVRQVLEGNEAGAEPRINIVGYLVGNGCTDPEYDGNAHPLYAAGKSLLPWRGFREMERECGGSFWNITPGSTCQQLWGKLSENLAYLNVYDTLQYCFHDGPASVASSSSSSSDGGGGGSNTDTAAVDVRAALRNARVALQGGPAAAAAAAAAAVTFAVSSSSNAGAAGSGGSGSPAAAGMVERLRAAGLLGQWPLAGGAVKPGRVLNWAHVKARLAELQQQEGQQEEEGQQQEGQEEQQQEEGRLGGTPPCTDSRGCEHSGPRLAHAPPCTDSRVADMWLNDPRVREAIHAAPLSDIGEWTLCSDKISYYRTHGSMIPIHVNNTRGHGLRALIYSGDHDMAVPHTGSEAWTGDLGFAVQQPWQPWFVADSQVAGYFVEYGHGLTYATVKGAGHMVPETNPREALAMFQRFIEGKSLA